MIGSKEVQRITNHPIHLKDQSGNLSPTALIPFCEFGGNMSVMGVKLDQFDIPICNSFRPKILRDQLCYSINPNEFRKYSLKTQTELELSLLIDYNEERQLTESKKTRKKSKTLKVVNNEENFITIHTLGPQIIIL